MSGAPPDYGEVTGQQLKGGQMVVPPGAVPVAAPGGPALVAYPTTAGPIYVRATRSGGIHILICFIP